MSLEEFNLITIRPAGRSASVFLQSLLDSHPQILSLPSMFAFYYYWQLYHGGAMKPWHRRVERLVQYYVNQSQLRFLFEGADSEFCTWVDSHGSRRQFKIDKSRFVDALLSELGNEYPSRKKMLLAVHQAFKNVANLDLANKRFILLHEHLPYEFEAAIRDFPAVKQIVTVRDPRNVFASAVKQVTGLNSLLPDSLLLWQELNKATAALRNASVFESQHPGHLHYVSMEQLNSQPKETLQALAQWIGLEWHASLLQPTLAGYPQGGFSVFVSGQRGFDREGSLKSRWVNYCSSREVALVDCVFARGTVSGRVLWKTLLPDFEARRLRFKGMTGRMVYFLSLHWLATGMIFTLLYLRKHRRHYLGTPVWRIRLFYGLFRGLTRSTVS